MIERDDFLATMAGPMALGTPIVVAGPESDGVEPRPDAFDFEEVGSCPCDASATTVCMALGKMAWDSLDPIKPLLVVQPGWYSAAIEIAVELNQKIAVWATPFQQRDPQDYCDAWFLVWRGRRVGSEGA